MHVFIDDSGDGGMKFDKGSSQHLVMAACIFNDPREIEKLESIIKRLLPLLGKKTEFKFSKTKETHKQKFFEEITPLKFNVRVIVIDKSIIYSPALRSSPKRLKSFTIGQLLSHGFDTIHNAKIVIDGQDTKSFGIPDGDYLKGLANRSELKVIDRVQFGDSRELVGVQLADMIAGATRKFVDSGREQAEYFDTFRFRTFQPEGTFWMFK